MDNSISMDVYKELLWDMIRRMTDERFLRQIYSIVLTHEKRTGS